MPEIICIPSSPPDLPPKQREGELRQSLNLARDTFTFHSDDFDFSGLSADLEFPTLQSTKKRKLSLSDSDIAVPPPKPAKLQVYTISDDENIPIRQSSTKKNRLSTQYQWNGLLSDPIGFSSSAPEVRATNNGKATVVDLSDDLPEDIMALGDSFSLSQPTSTANGRKHLSERTANLLAGLHTKPPTLGSKIQSYNAPRKKVDVRTYTDDIITSSAVSKTTGYTTKASKQTDTGNDARARERATAKSAKDREKEEERKRKRLAKEQKAREKQEAADIATVNRSKTDKKVSVTEMIVEMSRSLQGSSVCNQVLEHMKHLEVETRFFEEEVDLLKDDHVADSYGNLVKWRRKITARYNDDAGHWEPIAEQTIETERHILVHLTASDFANTAMTKNKSDSWESSINEEAMMQNIDVHVSNLRRKYKDCKPIYLVEGLEAFLRKNKTAKNRAYTAAVLSQVPQQQSSQPSQPSGPLPAPAPTQARQRKKKPSKASSTPFPDYTFLDTDLLETLLLHLQLTHSVLIHHTTTPTDTAFWIRTFTEHISTIPYRHERMSLNDAGAAFCMDVGQVKTGDSAQDTYVKMLQEVQRVTPAMAYGIANLYPSVKKLVKAFREQGPLVLEDVRKGANRDGAVTDGRLGPAVSRRLYKVFMGRNEGSTDGIA